MHTFHLIQPHPKCPNLTGWYLELQPHDFGTFMDVHIGVCAALYHKFGQDSHYDPQGPYNVRRLIEGWLKAITESLKRGPVLINIVGGWLPFEDAIILGTKCSEELDWPDVFDDEIITISKWPGRRYYYLCSSRARIFPTKYSRYTTARSVAMKFVPSDRIKSDC